jgi:hypothetical protein
MALVAANVDGHVLFQIEELIDDFQTRDVAVLEIEYAGIETVAIGYLQGPHEHYDTASGEDFMPILAFLPAEMNSAFEFRVEIKPVMLRRSVGTSERLDAEVDNPRLSGAKDEATTARASTLPSRAS